MEHKLCKCCGGAYDAFPGHEICRDTLCNAEGDTHIQSSDSWWIFNNGSWREMTVDEQLKESL